MRLLHTSDWHLGATIEKASCEEEQTAFLEWLVDELDERETDVLVVSGDVFHYRDPSNAAERLYFDFLVACARLDGLRKVVVVAGNHDSPSKLEAPERVLQVLDVHVVGRMPDDEAIDSCLIPIRGDGGEVQGVVAAVPYVRDARLGLTVRGTTAADRREQYVQAFEELYRDVARRARDRWPDVPLVATGHLTCYAPSDQGESGDFDTAIHAADPDRAGGSTGHIEPLGPEVFDAEYDYAALGHLHRSMRVGDSVAHYSGTPVPTKLDEAATGRRVLDVRWPDGSGEPEIEWVEVPLWRDVVEFQGPPDDVLDQLRELAYEKPLPPYLYLEVELGREEAASDVLARAQAILDERFADADRPRIVDDRYFDASAGEASEGFEQSESLDDLEPVEVFCRKYERDRGADEQPSEELLEAFRQLENDVRAGEE
ncbi:MAG: exonuclease SbcCD subunit D C-terminal domain-containing protein [Bradymonadaceae bacterium]